jgi:hypothetical protein
MRKKMGRPRLSKKGVSKEIFSVRMPPDEAREVWEAIRSSGQSKPEWLRSALLKAARTP